MKASPLRYNPCRSQSAAQLTANTCVVHVRFYSCLTLYLKRQQ